MLGHPQIIKINYKFCLDLKLNVRIMKADEPWAGIYRQCR
jgi:hypothetical protein